MTSATEMIRQGRVLANHANAIRRLGRNIFADAVEIGRRLIEVNKQIEHGRWLPWLKAEFAWSETTARRFMQFHALAKAKSSKLADLDLPLSGLYLLAAPSTPPAVCDEIIDRAGRGEKVKHGEIVERVRGQKPRAGVQKAAVPPGGAMPDLPIELDRRAGTQVEVVSPSSAPAGWDAAMDAEREMQGLPPEPLKAVSLSTIPIAFRWLAEVLGSTNPADVVAVVRKSELNQIIENIRTITQWGSDLEATWMAIKHPEATP